jgi:GMP synthase (glutamine-hydrolysing)
VRTAVAIRHVHFEDLGILAPLLERSGYHVSYRDAGIDDLGTANVTGADLLVVLGAPLCANDDALFPFITNECRLLERRLQHNLPTLGICLGAQLLARTLGARVYPGPRKEIGWMPIQLTEAGRRSALGVLERSSGHVLQWHDDTFDLPAGATHLALTEICPNQAFLKGNALALQFHIEADTRAVERWLIGHVNELQSSGVDIRKLREDSQRIGPPLRSTFEAAFESWLRTTL